MCGLAGGIAWDEQCCEEFDGMFAFAIWDAPAGCIFLARDRMGQKPLYLAVAPSASGQRVGAIAFASELGALRALPWVDAATDFVAMGHYLRWGYVPAPMTIYRGSEKLTPARWVGVRANDIELEQYF